MSYKITKQLLNGGIEKTSVNKVGCILEDKSRLPRCEQDVNPEYLLNGAIFDGLQQLFPNHTLFILFIAY